jgi:hypothetical protein
MTAYVPLTNDLGIQPIANKETTAKHKLGRIIEAADPTYGAGEFIYLKGVASCGVGSWVTYNMDDGSTTLLAANAIGPVAVAMSACTASYYGWFQIQGKAVGKCLTGYADNARVWITSTAGSVDDTSVAGDGVNGATGASTTVVSSGVADFEIARPWVNDRTSFS